MAILVGCIGLLAFGCGARAAAPVAPRKGAAEIATELVDARP